MKTKQYGITFFFFFLQFIVFFWFIFISWRLITLQYCSGFCHTWDKVSNKFLISLSIFQPPFSAVVGSLSCVRLFATPQTPLSFSLSWSLFRFVSIDSVMVEVGLKFVSFHLVIILVHASVFNIWICVSIYIYLILAFTMQNLVNVFIPVHILCAFYRQDYWSGLSFPPPGDFPDPGTNTPLLHLLNLQVDSWPLCYLGSPILIYNLNFSYGGQYSL